MITYRTRVYATVNRTEGGVCFKVYNHILFLGILSLQISFPSIIYKYRDEERNSERKSDHP